MTGRENNRFLAVFFLLVILMVSLAACITPGSGAGKMDSAPGPAINTSVVMAPDTSEPAADQAGEADLVRQGNRNGIAVPQSAGPVSLTINSARRVSSLYNTSYVAINATGGKIILVLDVTVKNNGVLGGFVFTNKSIVVHDPDSNLRYNTSFRLPPGYRIGLENALDPPVTIVQNNSFTGQVLFAIPYAEKYTVNLIDSNKSLIATQRISFDDPAAAGHPVSLTINSVEKRPNLKNESFTLPGEIFIVFNITVKNTDLPQGFYFVEESATLQDLNGTTRVYPSVNGREKNVPKKLENPVLLPVAIKQNDTVSGQLLFVLPNKDTYRLNLIDSNRTILVSKTIFFR
jgi:hypothetical protein